jgi:glycosyltransferase involved in cell wall biosynthesis
MSKLKTVIFATHPFASNGYSKVVYHLAKELAKHDDIDLTMFGFQHYYTIENHRQEFPKNVKIFDAYANENPKGNGFGLDLVENFLKEVQPHVCVVYNDSTVVSAFLQKIRGTNVPTKIIVYYDQVTPYQKKEYIDLINKLADKVITFTPYWEDVVKDLGCILPTDYLCHGIDDKTYFPIPKELACRYFSLNSDDFIILNSNRNQPRKRLDIMMKAFAEVVSRLPDSNIKLLIGTSLTGAWNLVDIYERELKKRGVSFEVGKKHLIILDKAQRLSDHENCILMNTADIGINTCEGAGFELIQVEMGLCGKPQVIPNIGGLRESFDDTCSWIVEPTMAYYIDSSRDGVGGEAMLCDYVDYVDGIIYYYENRETMKKHGAMCRERFLRKYRWKEIGEKFYNQIFSVVPNFKNIVEIKSLTQEIEQLDLQSIQQVIDDTPKENKQTIQPQTPQVANEKPNERQQQPLSVEKAKEEEKPKQPTGTKPKFASNSKHNKRHGKKVKNPTNELLKLKKQIDMILGTLPDNK